MSINSWNSSIPVGVDYGGTGAISFTDHGILLGSGSDALTVTAAPTNGQVLIGATGSDPVLATLTAGTNITIVEASGSITISSENPPLEWNVVTDATQALAVNNGYIGNRGTAITMTLPASASVGTRIVITGLGAGYTTIAQNALQLIQIVDQATTVGVPGSLVSTEQFASIELVCVVQNTTFNVVNITGNWTIA